ncbi:homoserine transporter [Photobacterium angustum]|uniref:Homoserine/homoserine lactone efflux protein n=1 Tax=Photobacterium angustum TaxID=661 RepID=A0ABX5H858_PHOAN|nr:homoserine/homoserine lactone efflux protein [Photobacterium angustum]KJG36484.1 homoserine transporter [Photobacterium angustum]PSX12288.1 homoserine/homoserine lactone efflux protein [Photobacterium angustum]
MSMDIWLTFLCASILLSLIPGAGAISTMSNTIKHGFKSTLINNLGLQTGNLINIIIVGAGLGALLAKSETAFSVIKWIGVIYLIYLGYQKFREAGEISLNQDNNVSTSYMKLFSKAIIVNITNPKSIMFLVALLPQFLTASGSHWYQLAVLGTTMIVVDLLIMIGYSLLATRLMRIVKDARHMKLQNQIFGSLFIGAGALLGLSSH